MKVWIVGRTKMQGSSRCIGGLTADGKSLRLLKSKGGQWDTGAPFRVGQIWEVACKAVPDPVPPHMEDALASTFTLVGTEPNLRAHLLKVIKPWRGGVRSLFGGLMGFTGSNNGYVSGVRGIPDRSTWFWIPDRDLILRTDDGKHYDYLEGGVPRGLKYVGEPAPIARIAAGTLTRVSLARWWRQPDADATLEERCYAQVSGWYS